MSVPVTVLSGFLGSGKTTFLNRLMGSPSMRSALVLVNEVGEVPVDHLLVRQVDERMVVLPSGCVCCALREDLVTTLDDPALTRGRTHVVIETSGLADPTPLVATLVKHPALRERFHLGGFVVTVDATRAARLCADYPEAAKQLALADLAVITKCDLASPEAISEAEALVRSAAPESELRYATADQTMADWIRPLERSRHTQSPPEGAHVHTHGVRTFSVESAAPAVYPRLALWLSMMSQLNGDSLLRFKGLVRVTDHDAPVVVQAVQHVVFPSYTLERWPDGVAATRLTGIVHGMSQRLFADTLCTLREIIGGTAR